MFLRLTLKRCNVCNEIKPLDMFTIGANARYGRRNECKACTALINRKKRNISTAEDLAKQMEEARFTAALRLLRESPRSFQAAISVEPLFYKKYLQEEIEIIKEKAEARRRRYAARPQSQNLLRRNPRSRMIDDLSDLEAAN